MTTSLTDVQRRLDDEMPALLAKHDVPGAAWAVLKDGEVVDGATGLLSTATGVEATADSVFQIGSITKLWTSTLVMQLVDEGLLDLDAPVQRYLPKLRLRDADAAAAITTRQLLMHTAGFEGDIFTDTGPGDDAIEKYVEVLADVPQLFAPGEQFSYNNAGYCLLGRLVEVLREKTYDACLREHLFAPLGLTHAATSPYEAILFRAAVGHVQPEPDAAYEPAPMWAMARSNAPAGTMLAMRPRDLVTFARMHLEDGRSATGEQVLAPGTAAAMQARAVDLPPTGIMGSSWGLGFERFDMPTGDVVGHDGNTIGQSAFLRMVPEAGLAIALLTNGGDVFALYHDVVGRLLPELSGTSIPELPTPPSEPQPVDASRYVGTYSAEVLDLVVRQDEEQRIWVDTIYKGVFADMPPEEPTELVGFGPDSLIPLRPDRGMHMPHNFLGDDGTGRARYLHLGRAFQRA
ncbi:serine hydrolase domain-containing protein [Nocardioides marmotae]|nr:serine hydrolase domain-containing protein [Nocardioides marmotae]